MTTSERDTTQHERGITQYVKGSLLDTARKESISLAEVFLGADLVVIVDVSGSMAATDSRDGKSRYEVACEELAKLQALHPGKVALLAFSNTVHFCPTGIPLYVGSGTDLAGALTFAKIADVPGVRFVVISDGYPDNGPQALKAAQTYSNRIDTIYVGPLDMTDGLAFLRKLAEASGGVQTTAEKAKELADAIEKLYLNSGS